MMAGFWSRLALAKAPAATDAAEPSMPEEAATSVRLEIEELGPRRVPSLLVYPIGLELPVTAPRGQ
jgi:hypothetical protein